MRLESSCGARALWLSASLSLLLQACGERPQPVGGEVDLRAVLGARDVAGYERATAAPQLSFPRDHGPHEGFRTEWWYWTGNVHDDAGRAFGF